MALTSTAHYLDPASPEALGDEIARMAAHLDAATHRLLTCIRQFDESEEWGRQGALSCGHWLSWRIGLDLATAREKVRVARALGTLPRIDDALRRGVLSYAKVRALTRVATPELEERLLDMAVASTGAQLERICRCYRRVVREQFGDERPDDERHVRHDVLPSGMVRIQAVLHPDEAAMVLQAIEAARHQRAGAPSAGGAAVDLSAETSRLSPSAASSRPAAVTSSADALVKVAESFLAHADADGRGGGDRHQILIHLEQDPLAPDGAFVATLDDGTRLSAETFRRVACDAGLVPVITDQKGNPLRIGRRTRAVSPALRRALWSRDRGCRFPGCPHKRFVQAHHIDHWAHGGETSLTNMILLCSAHHRALHEGGFRVTGSPDHALVFHDRKGRIINHVPPPIDLRADAFDLVISANTDAGLDITADTNMSIWDGSPVDYGAAMDVLVR